MRKMIEWIVTNKDFLTIIITALIGIGSILVGVVTVVVMKKQIAITERQIEMQNAELQPVFHVLYEILDLDDDKVYDTEILRISNEGATVRHIEDIDLKTFITIESTVKRIKKITTIPITAYYWAQSHNANLTGNLLTAYYKNNHYKYCDLDRAAMQYSKDLDFYFLSKNDLIKIKYIDINGVDHDVYYNNKRPINKDEYEKIIESASMFNNDVFDIDKITIEDLLKCIDNE